MRTNHIHQLTLGALVAVSVSGGIALAATSASGSTSGSTSRLTVRPTSVATVPPRTPDSCILLNGGDYNACNVDNDGRGDLPYRITRPLTPNDCILLNQGDYNACNVSNNGRGDLPYRRMS